MLLIVGKVTVPASGTPVRLTDTAEYKAALAAAGLNPSGGAPVFKTAQAVYFQAWKANTGQAYIGTSAMVRATGVGVAQVLVIPSATAVPSWGIAQQTTGEGVTLSDIFLDVDVSAEGVLVSLLIS